jgi:hypothetical protein
VAALIAAPGAGIAGLCGFSPRIDARRPGLLGPAAPAAAADQRGSAERPAERGGGPARRIGPRGIEGPSEGGLRPASRGVGTRRSAALMALEDRSARAGDRAPSPRSACCAEPRGVSSSHATGSTPKSRPASFRRTRPLGSGARFRAWLRPPSPSTRTPGPEHTRRPSPTSLPRRPTRVEGRGSQERCDQSIAGCFDREVPILGEEQKHPQMLLRSAARGRQGAPEN